MIYTCTLNPSVDYLVQADQIKLGDLNRAQNVSFFPGGKGINVSRVLRNLDIDSIALGFLGGFTGDFIRNELNKEGISNDFIYVEEPTRINVKLKTKEETEINGVGSYISEIKQEELLQKFQSFTSDDYVVLAGSLPASVSTQFYEALTNQCSQNGSHLIVDTSGESLKNLLKYQPFLVKPNHHELGEILNRTLTSLDEVIASGKELLRKGPQNIIVSMGGDGAVFINNSLTAVATVPKGEVVSTVGSGDSTVAGFLAEYVKSGDFLKAFQYGVASGTATAFSNDLCNKSRVEEVLPKVEIELLDKEMTS